MTIAELLELSRAAHSRYRYEQQIRKNPGAARLEMLKAAQLRRQAHEDDPTHSDMAWAIEPPNFNHAALLAFYHEQLNRG